MFKSNEEISVTLGALGYDQDLDIICDYVVRPTTMAGSY